MTLTPDAAKLLQAFVMPNPHWKWSGPWRMTLLPGAASPVTVMEWSRPFDNNTKLYSVRFVKSKGQRQYKILRTQPASVTNLM